MLNILNIFLFSVVPVIQDVFLVLLIIRGVIINRKRGWTGVSVRRLFWSSSLLWTGTFCGGLFSIPVTVIGLGLLDQGPDGVWYLFEGFILVSIAMLLAYCNSTIEYDGTGFTVSNIFGGKHRFRYGDISGIWNRGVLSDIVLYCGRRKIRLDYLLVGREVFVAYANQAYFNRYKANIPEQTPKFDPMKGNVDTPWVYLFYAVLVFVLSTIVLIIFPVYVLQPPDDSIPKEAVEIHTAFSSFDKKKFGEDIILYAPDHEKPFVISWKSGYEISLPEPETLCGGRAFYIVAVEGKEQYSIYAISDENHNSIITAYDYNTAYRNYSRIACILMLIAGIIADIFAVFWVLVGRYPKRYPAWVRRIFYQDWMWTVDFTDGE